MRILATGDWHTPYMLEGYLEWVESVYKKWGCDTIMQMGDARDKHALSFFDKDPDAPGDKLERMLAKRQTEEFFRLHKTGYMVLSNHDKRPYRKARSVGLGSAYLKDFNTNLDIPVGWNVADYHIIDGVRYEHGDRIKGITGATAFKKLAIKNRMNTVSNHFHAAAGIAYMANDLDMIWGMNTGSGVDMNTYGLAYSDFPDKAIISCGIITDGKPFIEIKDLGQKVKLIAPKSKIVSRTFKASDDIYNKIEKCLEW